MALCPFARHRLIPPGANDPQITVVGAVLHVDAGNAESLYDYFNGPSGGIESHFHVRRDGVIEQYRDTAYEADANHKGNSWVSGGRRYGLASIETQGYEDGEWTPEQLDSIKDLLAWLASEHGFPLQKAPSWRGPGVGYHVMWGAPGPWTPRAKSCPGPGRIRQFDDELVPWMTGYGDTLPDTGGTMSWDDDADITPLASETLSDSASRKRDGLLGYAASAFYRLYDRAWARWVGEQIWTNVWLESYLSDARNTPAHTLRDNQRDIHRLHAKIDALAEQLDTLVPGLKAAVEETAAEVARTEAASVAAEDVAGQLEVSVRDADTASEGTD